MVNNDTHVYIHQDYTTKYKENQSDKLHNQV